MHFFFFFFLSIGFEREKKNIHKPSVIISAKNIMIMGSKYIRINVTDSIFFIYMIFIELEAMDKHIYKIKGSLVILNT